MKESVINYLKKLKTSIGEKFVWLALNDLKKENLLAQEFEINDGFNGLSRRQVIRKIRFASMVVLPVISSLVAPTAANAQTGGFAAGSRTYGQSCNTSTDCASSAPNCTSTKICCIGTDSLAPNTIRGSCEIGGASCCNVGSFATPCCSGVNTATAIGPGAFGVGTRYQCRCA